MSLMCRYFPQGTKIFQVTLPDKVGLRAIAGEKNGKYTFAIVNSHTVAYTINLRMADGIQLSNVKIYNYVSGKNAAFTGALDADGFAKPATSGITLDLKGSASKQMDIPAQSFCLITNMD